MILYVKGTLIPEDEAAVAMVGTRHATAYGLRTARRLASELAERGITVVSGLARGIDGEAHRGALRAGGRTLAVLGCGLDQVYPRDHGRLYEEISEHGALVSEFPLGTEPEPFHFPMRNRIIAGLAMGTVVVEAAHRSGSLITASYSLEEGRGVYAVPGPIDSVTSLGTNQLIQSGAMLISSARDILEDLAPQIRDVMARHWARDGSASGATDGPAAKSSDTLRIPSQVEGQFQSSEMQSELFEAAAHPDACEHPLLKLLANQPLYCDEIAARLNADPAEINQQLTVLELDGSIKRVWGGRYARR